MPKRLAKKLLIIGWDGADWQIAKPLMDRGEMPVLADLVSKGVMGNLASMEPMISPMLWTTMATGRSPKDHGICGFMEPAPETETGTRVTSSVGRKCEAFWNILTQAGINVNVVGWFASHPAEPIHGICVSDRFCKHVGTIEEPWPSLPAAVHPKQLVATLDELRVHPQDISLEMCEYFVPRAKEVDQEKDKILSMLATELAHCATNQAVTTWIMETQPWEVLGVYLTALDHLCHLFMCYAPPRMPQVDPDRQELYQGVVEAGYRFHDLLLSRLLKLAGDDTTVLLVSDHGYQTGHRRPNLTPDEPAGPVIWHRPFGMIAMRGPGIKQDELIFGSSIADVTPTILTLLGLPVGYDMIGRPLQQAFVEPLVVERIPSWEQVPGEAGMHPPDVQADSFAEQAAMEQLIELGYVEKLSEDRQQRIDVAVTEYHYNLGRALLALGEPHSAIEHLEPLHRKNPKRLMVALHLADCYQRARRLDDCRQLLDYIASGECFARGLENKQQRILPQVDLLYGLLEMNSNNLEAALERLTKAEQHLGNTRGLHTHLGNLYRRMERWDEAERAYAKALEIDPDDHAALTGMAILHFRAERIEQAVEAALQSLFVLYHQPHVHFLLANAFAKLGQHARAREALEVTLRMNPNLVAAREMLRRLNATVPASAAAKA